MSEMIHMKGAITLWVPGIPIPQGSKSALHRHNAKPGARPILIDSNAAKLKPWRSTVGAIAGAEMQRRGLTSLIGPVVLELILRFPRPKGHYNRKGQLLHSAPPVPGQKPDLDKCLRAICDALTGIAYADDARVVDAHVLKRYADKRGAGAAIRVSSWRPR